MHRTIEIALPPVATDRFLSEVQRLEDVIGLSVNRGASVKPPGDVVVIHTLNRGADEVLRLAEAARWAGPISVVTAVAASFIDPEHDKRIANDVDEGIWEEVETGLRHQGRVTANYLTLMALGGAIAAVGLVSEPVPQALAFVSASIIAPAFEPIAKVPLGLALGRWRVAWRGLVSAMVGYVALTLAAGLAFALLRTLGEVTLEGFSRNPEVERIVQPGVAEVLVSACGAAAGMVIMVAYRRSVIAGPLVALATVPAAATIGVGLAAGLPSYALEGLERLGLDALLILVLGALVVLVKQATVHRRRPMV